MISASLVCFSHCTLSIFTCTVGHFTPNADLTKIKLLGMYRTAWRASLTAINFLINKIHIQIQYSLVMPKIQIQIIWFSPHDLHIIDSTLDNFRLVKHYLDQFEKKIDRLPISLCFFTQLIYLGAPSRSRDFSLVPLRALTRPIYTRSSLALSLLNNTDAREKKILSIKKINAPNNFTALSIKMLVMPDF